MKERTKILELLAAGKITSDQAEQLLEALEQKSRGSGHGHGHSFGAGGFLRGKEKINFDEIKNIGSQVSSAVTQSLQEAKRVIEQQVETLKASMTFLSVSKEFELPESLADISVETLNGRIQVGKWDRPYVSVVIRAQVRANQLSEARERLEESITTSQSDSSFQLLVNRNAQVEAHVDIFVPDAVNMVSLLTQNGGIHVDSLSAKSLHMSTANGGIRVYRARTEAMKSVTENGSIEIAQSITEMTQRVYLETKNGKISITGITPGTRLRGEAKTQHGKVDVQLPDVLIQREDGTTRSSIVFEPKTSVPDAGETLLYCETRHGYIRIEP